MDAHLQLLLATTWENEKGSGLQQLRQLAENVSERIAQASDVFETERDRYVAVQKILNTLQYASQTDLALDRSSYSMDDWSVSPVGQDLPRLHSEARAPFQVVTALASEAKEAMGYRMPQSIISKEIRARIRMLGEREHFPFHVPALAACVMVIASRSGKILESEVAREVANYERAAEELLADSKRMKRMELVTEFLPSARKLSLTIDKAYSWGDLADRGAKRTSLQALGDYTQLNHYGHVSDARFSPQRVSVNILPSDFFYSTFTIWFLRASTLMFSGDDRETRVLRRSIVNSERADVRVNGRKVRDSLVLMVPLDDGHHDIERHIALFLMRLNNTWQSRHMGPRESAEFLEKLPHGLRDLVSGYGMQRKFCDSKKSILYGLCGLIAETTYRYRDRHRSILGPLGVKTRGDIDEYVAKEIYRFGFQYNAETLRRRRSTWRREFLDRVPEVFGLDEKPTQASSR